MTHPVRQPGQSLDDHQREMAEWMGCSVADMNATHDEWHKALCRWLGVPSHSMAWAKGEAHDKALAWLEEDATLAVSRFALKHGVAVPM